MRTLVLAATIVLAAGIGAYADPTFSYSQGDLAAEAVFHVSGNQLSVTLTNTSTADAMVPTDILTAVFFDTSPTIALTRVSAVLNSGSTVLFGTSDAGGVVGGEFAFASGLSGAPGNSALGVSSTGLGLFGPGDVFPGTNLQGPDDPDGLQYGLTSAGDNPLTGNTPVTGKNALVKNSVIFTFTFDPVVDFAVSNVSFLYGTSLGDNLLVPAPGAFILAMIGLGLVSRFRSRSA